MNSKENNIIFVVVAPCCSHSMPMSCSRHVRKNFRLNNRPMEGRVGEIYNTFSFIFVFQIEFEGCFVGVGTLCIFVLWFDCA